MAAFGRGNSAASKLEVHCIAAAIVGPASVRIGLRTRAHGLVADEAIACRRHGSGHCRAIRRILDSLARVLTAAHRIAHRVLASGANAIAGASIRRFAVLERRFGILASRGRFARIRILDQAREIGCDAGRTFGWIIRNLHGAIIVAITAQSAVECVELVARICAILRRIAAARRAGAARTGTARRAARGLHLAATRHSKQ